MTEASLATWTVLLRNLLVASDRYRAALADRALGLRSNEMAALDHLHEHGGLTPRELGAHLRLTSGTMTQLVDRLENTGYAVRERHPTDRRSVSVRLTHLGTERITAIHDVTRSDLEEALAGADGDQLRVLRRFVETLTSAFRRRAMEENVAALERADQRSEGAASASG